MKLTAQQAACELGISYSTVLRRIEAGELVAWQLYPGGMWRIDPSELVRYVTERLDVYPDAFLQDLRERYRGL